MYICTMRSIMVLVELFLNATAYRYILRHVTGHVYIYIFDLDWICRCNASKYGWSEPFLYATICTYIYIHIHVWNCSCFVCLYTCARYWWRQGGVQEAACRSRCTPSSPCFCAALLLALVASHASNIYIDIVLCMGCSHVTIYKAIYILYYMTLIYVTYI